MRSCSRLRALSVKHLTPERVLAPPGCRSTLHADLGTAHRNWRGLSGLTHVQIFDRGCPNAARRVGELPAIAMPNLMLLHLDIEDAVGRPSKPFRVSSNWGKLQHVIFSGYSINLQLNAGPQLLTLVLESPKIKAQIAPQAVATLQAVHVKCQAADLDAALLSALERPFKSTGALGPSEAFPMELLEESDHVRVAFPERAAEVPCLLAGFRCGACEACLVQQGIMQCGLERPPERCFPYELLKE
jgi:hypothetical protein